MKSLILTGLVLLIFGCSENNGSKTGNSGERPSPEEITNASDYFKFYTFPDVLEPFCSSCHTSSGLASASRFRVSAGDWEGSYSNISTLLNSVSGEYLASKSRGLEAHGGGAVLTMGTDEFEHLTHFIELLTGRVITYSNEQYWENVTLESRKETLRRSALLFAGRLPTDQEYNLVEGGESELRSVIRNFMEGDSFHEFILRGANDRILTEKYLKDWPTILDGNEQLPQWTRFRYEKTKNRDAADEEFLNVFQYRAQQGVAFSVQKLFAYIVENDRDYREIVTADYMMFNPYLAFVYGVKNIEFDDPQDVSEFKPGRIEGMTIKKEECTITDWDPATPEPNILSHCDYIDFPHSGILSHPSFMLRYPSTETNRNRARSRWVNYHFLGFDIEASAQRTMDTDALADTNNPTMLNPACTGCHEIMDPIAGAYHDFGDTGFYRDSFDSPDSLPETYRDTVDYQYGDFWYSTMRSPGFSGNEISNDTMASGQSIVWLGHRIAADGRFPMSVVKFWWPSIFGAEVVEAPLSSDSINHVGRSELYQAQMNDVENLGTILTKNWNLKDLLVEMVMSPWYRAKGVAIDTQSYENLGKNTLLNMDQLEAKYRSVLGFIPEEWSGKDVIKSTNQFSEFDTLFGGIDSSGIIERSKEMTTLMFHVAEALALKNSCQIVFHDFYRENVDRYIFKGLTGTFTPKTQFEQWFTAESFDFTAPDRFSVDVELPSGDWEVGAYLLNAQWFGAINKSRNLAIFNIDITNSKNNVIASFNHADYANSSCGYASHNGAYVVDSECSVDLAFTAPTDDIYTITINVANAVNDGETTGYVQSEVGRSEFVLNVNSRTLSTTATFENQSKSKLVELYRDLLGLWLTEDSPEISLAFDLLVEAYNERIANNSAKSLTNADEVCELNWNYLEGAWNSERGRVAVRDPYGVKASWRTVLIFLLTDYKFLHE